MKMMITMKQMIESFYKKIRMISIFIQNQIKQTLNLFKLYYYSYYNIVNFICTILIYFVLGKIFTLMIDHNSLFIYDINKKYNIIKTLPSISCIKNYFYYKNDLINHHTIFISKLNININTWQKPLSELVIIQRTSNSHGLDYIPSRNIRSYFPMIEMSFNLIKDLINDYFKSRKDPVDMKPIFEITPPYVEATPLDKEVVINNDLPFEAPIIIEVTLDDNDTNDNDTGHKDIDDSLIAYIASNTVSEDTLSTIYAPGYLGPRVFTDDAIYDMHLDIVSTVRSILNQHEVLNQRDACIHIQNIVHQFMVKNQLLYNLSLMDLKNKNHLINMIIETMLINSIFTQEDESFILQQVTKCLIIESLCAVNHIDTSSYYNDPYCDEYIKTIIARFLSALENRKDT
jgi:hypothetical protein